MSTGREDPLYEEGMAHLQRGEWDDAIDAFEKLQNKYPESSLAQQALEQAQVRARMDTTRVRGKRWTVRIWPILVRLIIIGLIGFLIYTGGQLLVERVRPMIAAARQEQMLEQLLVDAAAYLEAGNLEAAEEQYLAVLEIEASNAVAEEGLAMIARDRGIEEQYRDAVSLEEAGDYQAALESYRALAKVSPRYRDIDRRMERIEARLSLEQLYEDARELDRSGEAAEALAAYEAVRDRNLNYEQDFVEQRLYELYLQLGNEIIDQEPPRLEDLAKAQTYFTRALALKPRSQEAGVEQQLLKLFLEGQTAYYNEQWTQAASAFRVVYDTRPDYLGDTVLNLLYESYVRSGDQYKAAGDNHLAYEQYQKALDLPVEDTSFAQGRIFYVKPFLTPTLTPTPTPTPSPRYAGPPATQVPLSSYTNKIVFMADYPNRGEIWIMDPDGQNRRRLGRDWQLREQFEDLEDQERYSPDGDRFAFVQNPSANDSAPQVFVTIPVDQRVGGRWFTQLTQLDDMCYDPVWSPDGTRIAFVTPAIDSDDIWVVNVDGSNPQPLTPNPWEWDKHPSWSPDSEKIVFWSNRSGLMQLYVMNADGTEIVNISNTQWDEYDPVWIK
jgi:tetratricopeptide (TPR) repeat protein